MPSKSVLSGDLTSIGLADIFTLLGMAKKSGVLRLTRGAETRTLHWEAGEIVFARSNSVRDSLGNFLVRKGIITPEQNAVSASKIDETTRHGKVLVRMGFITADQLLWAVKQQVIEVIYSLFHWRNGFFEFLEGEADAKEKITLSMSTTKVVMEGIHRLDEWGKIRATFPDDSLVLEPALAPAEVAGRPDLDAEEKKIFPLVDGSRTLGEVANIARLGEYECYAALFRLHAAGAIRPQGAASAPRRAAR
ncbi:MAG TPA: DUF4388 domain-containing protein [Candidatus Polarisedimenticolia bacterium]|nr:DUF4388 domain-containing protein [Candidatus Polarisedimenticolia bacterium]